MSKKTFLGRDDLIIKKMDGETVLYEESADRVHSLNTTATLVWDLCDGKNEMEGMVKEVLARFEVDEATARSDVENILREFKEKGLLRGD